MVWLKISATERNLENHQKLPNFAGSLWPSHLTKIWSWGTNGKRISISFIWYLVMQNISIILVTLTTFTTRGQTENEKMGSDMSISSEVPDLAHCNVTFSWRLKILANTEAGMDIQPTCGIVGRWLYVDPGFRVSANISVRGNLGLVYCKNEMKWNERLCTR